MKIIVFIYLLIFYGLIGGLRSYVLYKRTGINPFKLKNDDSIQGFSLMVFKIVFILITVVVSLYSFGGSYYNYVVPIPYLSDIIVLKIIGAVLSLFALIWCFIAQLEMNDSWRIGIDKTERTALVTSGLFKFSRNPIFFGMLISGLGLFLFLPSAVTCITLTMSWISISVQIRLEEAYLLSVHGSAYEEYRAKVRRWI